MKIKFLALIWGVFGLTNSVQSQGILKKIKDRASAVTGKDNKNSENIQQQAPKIAWCDTGLVNTNTNYSLAYSSPEDFTIMYDESSLGMGRSNSDYRLILKKFVNNKPQYVIIDNGNVTATVDELTDKDILGGVRTSLAGLNPATKRITDEKYLVQETFTAVVPGQKAQTVTAPQKINTNYVNQRYEMMKQTEEYKNMSAEEKKELEEMMKQMPGAVKEYNNSGIAGKTITSPDIQGGTYSGGTGYYSVIIKGTNYGKFAGAPLLAVSADESNVYIVGADITGKTYFIVNGKKISLDAKNQRSDIHIGNLFMSPDGKKAAFAENKLLTESEQEKMVKDIQNGLPVKQQFIITKSDGSSFQITKSSGDDKFRIANTGAVIYIEPKTGEIFSDNKVIGKINTLNSEDLKSEALLFGSDLSTISYYNSDGSISFMDGSRIDMGILYPVVISEGNKKYITWFRKCKHDIYIGKYEF